MLKFQLRKLEEPWQSQFDIFCPLSVLSESCALYHWLATWSVFLVSLKSHADSIVQHLQVYKMLLCFHMQTISNCTIISWVNNVNNSKNPNKNLQLNLVNRNATSFWADVCQPKLWVCLSFLIFLCSTPTTLIQRGLESNFTVCSVSSLETLCQAFNENFLHLLLV